MTFRATQVQPLYYSTNKKYLQRFWYNHVPCPCAIPLGDAAVHPVPCRDVAEVRFPGGPPQRACTAAEGGPDIRHVVGMLRVLASPELSYRIDNHSTTATAHSLCPCQRRLRQGRNPRPLRCLCLPSNQKPQWALDSKMKRSWMCWWW